MKIWTIVGGPFMTNSYLVADEGSGQAMIVDAPMETTETLVEKAAAQKLAVRYIVNTHGHFDHTADNVSLKLRTNAELLCHKDDAPFLAHPEEQMRLFGLSFDVKPSQADRYLAHGETLSLGALNFRILHCPGHSPGSILLHEAAEGVCFCGDVILPGSVGRTDLPGAGWPILVKSIRDNVLTLPDETKLLCGHGPASSIEQEKAENSILMDIMDE